jgi:hypothetical protein
VGRQCFTDGDVAAGIRFSLRHGVHDHRPGQRRSWPGEQGCKILPDTDAQRSKGYTVVSKAVTSAPHLPVTGRA